MVADPERQKVCHSLLGSFQYRLLICSSTQRILICELADTEDQVECPSETHTIYNTQSVCKVLGSLLVVGDKRQYFSRLPERLSVVNLPTCSPETLLGKQYHKYCCDSSACWQKCNNTNSYLFRLRLLTCPPTGHEQYSINCGYWMADNTV